MLQEALEAPEAEADVEAEPEDAQRKLWAIWSNVNPGLINPGWFIVVVPPNSD